MIDLSALEEDLQSVPCANNKPLELALSAIDEDPGQPRKEFSAKAMTDMVASIVATGVRSPVSVRPHPEGAGRYLLNFGARRYRASKAAGRKTIPAFIDENHDRYDQVIENLQRVDLTPMELALFIERKQLEGLKPAEIARRLGKQKSVITHHLSLIDPPTVIEHAYTSGRCTSPRTLYELRRLHDEFPESVQEWAASAAEITRASVDALASELRKVITPSATGRLDELKAGVLLEAGDASATSNSVPDAREVEVPENDTGVRPSQAGPIDYEIMEPVLTVNYDGRTGSVMLDQRPTEVGLMKIRFEDGSEAEVACERCSITGLFELSDASMEI